VAGLERGLTDGAIVGSYRTEALIGRGGMGAVYLAEHVHLRRRVALKVLPPGLAHDPAFRERFIRESQLTASIDHPNIIPVHDADDENGVLYIAMRYVEGSDLNSVLSQEGRLSPARALAVL
jgi:serine/threonine protein kinase